MFCPQCNAEYRPGFTRCSDCDVDLVQDPSHFALAAKSPAAPGDPNEDPYCSFWKGQDARVHAELCEVLEQAGIPCKTVYRSDHLFNLSNFPAYEVGVPFSLFDKAEKAVEEAYSKEDYNGAEKQEFSGLIKRPPGAIPILPESVTLPPEDVPGPPAADDGDGWYPEDATATVWSREGGSESEVDCNFLVAALHENGIHCRLDQQGTSAKLYVLPHEASRAREIIREVVEGSPPQ
jgi:hypothetical protein